MTAAADTDVEDPPKKKSKLPLILGLVLAIAGAGGGFMVVDMGMLGGGAEEAHAEDETHVEVDPLAPAAFVPLERIVVNLASDGNARVLRFLAQLDVAPEYQSEVEAISPRIIDVLNGYLRAIEPADIEAPSALNRMRAQMLRRVQVVAGEGRVKDLLIMEFVVN